MNTVQHTCTRIVYVRTFSVKGPRSTGTIADQRTNVLSLSIPSTHTVHALHLIGKYLVKYSHESDLPPPRFFARFKRRPADQRSIARPICPAFDQQLESCVGKYTGRLQVCRCSYLLAFMSLSLFLSLPPTCFSRSLSASFSRSHSSAFPYLRPFLSAPRRAGICEIDARDRSPRISLSENALIHIRMQVTRS